MLTHRCHCPGLRQDDLVAEGVAERADKRRSSLWAGRASAWIRTYDIRQGGAFASPICWAPQGPGVSAEAWAKEQTSKLLSVYLLVESLRFGLMCF